MKSVKGAPGRAPCFLATLPPQLVPPHGQVLDEIAIDLNSQPLLPHRHFEWIAQGKFLDDTGHSPKFVDEAELEVAE